MDGIELEIIWSNLISIVSEQAKAMQRIAFSPIVREAGDLTEEQAWPRNFELAMEVFASKDSIEGATAFAEKRPPRWTGT